MTTQENKTLNIQFLPYLSERKYRIGATLNDFIEAIKQGNEVEIILDQFTKTITDSTMFCGGLQLSIDLAVNGFNTREYANKLNFKPVSGSDQRHLFKLTKKQGKNEYIQYLSQVIPIVEKSLGIEFKQDIFKVHTHIFE